MNNIEKRLKEEKKYVDQLEAPLELEGRLRKALDSTHKRKRISPIWKSIAVALLLFMFVGYNYNALAYYGKKIVGFDEVISGTLKELNEAGMGQIVDETVSLGNGSQLIIDGIMTDENQMVVYYTITDPTGEIEDHWSDLFSPSKITGFLTSANFNSSEGMFNEEGTELKGTMYFETPSPLAKTLTLHYSQRLLNDQMTSGTVSFSYNPNQAMQTEIKQKVNKTVTVDKGKIEFDSIIASPMSTFVRGTMNVDNFDRIQLGFEGITLVANGDEVQWKGSSNGSSLTGGSNFELRFDTLPSQLDSLELHVNTFVGYKVVDAVIHLQSIGDEVINLNGEDIWINQVSSTENGTEITITTEESILLDEVQIGTNQSKTLIETTVNQSFNKQEDGKILKRRTMVFPATEEPEQLFIGGLHYMKEYNQKLEIPLK